MPNETDKYIERIVWEFVEMFVEIADEPNTVHAYRQYFSELLTTLANKIRTDRDAEFQDRVQGMSDYAASFGGAVQVVPVESILALLTTETDKEA